MQTLSKVKLSFILGTIKNNERPKEAFQTTKKALNERIATSAIVPYIHSPYCFYIQEISDEFSEFEQKLQNYYQANRVALTQPAPGMACVAKYSEDQAWYRATIKAVNHETRLVRVFFVDYGNEDTLSMDGHNICELRNEFKAFPAMAIKCSLYGIKPNKEYKHTPVEIMDFMFLELASNKILVNFVDFAEDLYLVDVTYEKRITDEMSKFVNIKDGLIEKRMALPLGQHIATAKSVSTVSNDFLRLARSDKFQELSDMHLLMSDKFMADSVKCRNS